MTTTWSIRGWWWEWWRGLALAVPERANTSSAGTAAASATAARRRCRTFIDSSHLASDLWSLAVRSRPHAGFEVNDVSCLPPSQPLRRGFVERQLPGWLRLRTGTTPGGLFSLLRRTALRRHDRGRRERPVRAPSPEAGHVRSRRARCDPHLCPLVGRTGRPRGVAGGRTADPPANRNARRGRRVLVAVATPEPAGDPADRDGGAVGTHVLRARTYSRSVVSPRKVR